MKTTIAQSVDEAIAMIETLEDSDPDLRQALINLVKKGDVAVAIRDGEVCFQAMPTIQ
jgi:hypothetical protein